MRRIGVVVAICLALAGLTGIADTAAAAEIARINFQPQGASVPAGYVADWGQAFDATRGFGWVAQDSSAPLSLVGNARERNQVPDQRLDTLIHMQLPPGSGGVTTPARWEHALAAGDYDVTVSVGDPCCTNSVHRLAVEGTVAIAEFRPTTSTLFAQATVRVTVGDGRLTLDAAGGTNTKLDYVDIVPVAAGSPDLEIDTPHEVLGLGDRLVFSTVKETPRAPQQVTVRNAGTADLHVIGLAIGGPQADRFALAPGQPTSFTVAPGGSAPVSLAFVPPGPGVENYATLTITSDDPTGPSARVELAGLDAVDYEGANEPTMAQITRVLGYRTTIGTEAHYLGNTRQPLGEEVTSPYWVAASPDQPVTLHPVARYAGRVPTTAGGSGWHAKHSSTATTLFAFPGGPLPDGGENQKTFPGLSAGSATTFSPASAFGPFAGDLSIFSDDGKNGSTKQHNFRFYPAEGPDGAQVPNTWLVGIDLLSDPAQKNYDFQDYVYLLRNARPELAPAPAVGSPALSLGFGASVPGTVADADGDGTGFTSVQANSVGGAHQASLVDLDAAAGVLRLTSTAGTSAGTANNQVNALQLAFDAARRYSFRVEGRIVDGFTGLDAGSEEVAVFLGPDQDNSFKVAVQHVGGNASLVVTFEQNGTATRIGGPVALPDPATIRTLDLSIVGNLVNGTLVANYRVNSDDYRNRAAVGTVAAPADVMRWFSVAAKAGVLASNAGSSQAVVAAFDRFTVTT